MKKNKGNELKKAKDSKRLLEKQRKCGNEKAFAFKKHKYFQFLLKWRNPGEKTESKIVANVVGKMKNGSSFWMNIFLFKL